MRKQIEEELLTVKDVATIARVSYGTVYRWRYLGLGPPSVHPGRSVRYRRADVYAWLDHRKCLREECV